MFTGEKLGQAIEKAISEKKVSKAEVARYFGIKPPSVTGWIKTGRVSKEHIGKLVEFFADVVSPEHFGIENMTITNLPSISKGRETTTINLFDVSASCGHGVVNPDYPQLLRSIEIPNDALFELLGTNNPTNVQLMPPDGDSMEPTIPQKSITLIKTDVNEFQTGGIYLFTFDGYTYIKRLSRGKGGAIHATSDNRHYAQSDFLINPEEADKFHIHGKFWKVLPLDFLDL